MIYMKILKKGGGVVEKRGGGGGGGNEIHAPCACACGICMYSVLFEIVFAVFDYYASLSELFMV